MQLKIKNKKVIPRNYFWQTTEERFHSIPTTTTPSPKKKG